MAKRKRLTLPGDLPTEMAPAPAPASQPTEAPALFPLGASRSTASNTPASMAPIARVAAEASALAALSDLATEMATARDTGRMIQSLALDVVDADYLVRDRMVSDEAELEVLMQSLRARGQQVPIEVAALPPDHNGDRYGLISGWRRLSALRRLRVEAPDDARFARVLAIQRQPEAASEAYLAMVEENEIRVGLSYYERARIVARAAEQGVFPDTATALAQLFAAASRAKRSKIGSFLRIVACLDDRLRFASHIPERLGLSLSRALEADAGLAPRLRDRLRKTPAQTPEAELAVLEKSLAAPKPFVANPATQIPAQATPETAAEHATLNAVTEPVLRPDPTAQPRPSPDLAALPDSVPVSSPKPDAFLANRADWPAPPLPGTQEIPGVFVETGFGFVTLRGPKVTAYFQSQLLNLLRQFRD